MVHLDILDSRLIQAQQQQHVKEQYLSDTKRKIMTVGFTQEGASGLHKLVHEGRQQYQLQKGKHQHKRLQS